MFLESNRGSAPVRVYAIDRDPSQPKYPRIIVLPTLLVHEWHTANEEPIDILSG